MFGLFYFFIRCSEFYDYDIHLLHRLSAPSPKPFQKKAKLVKSKVRSYQMFHRRPVPRNKT